MNKHVFNGVSDADIRYPIINENKIDWYYWCTVMVGLSLIAAFNYAPMTLAVTVAIILVFLLTRSMVQKMPRSLGYLLIASCYERPILDFGIGIRGTIKLVDLVIIALILAVALRQFSGKLVRGSSFNVALFSLSIITIMAVVSSLLVLLLANYSFDDTRKSIYYAVILIEYSLAFWAIQKIDFTAQDVKKYFSIFLFGLVIVAVIGILQGLGILENEYYTSATAITKIEKDWAISVLGPNHTHLGTYMALAVALSVMFLHQKFQIRFVVSALICMAALAFSHSAVGFGMIGLYIAFTFFTGDKRMKSIATALGVVAILGVILYMTGIAGEDAERTAEKYDISSEDSEILLRSFVYPVELLAAAAHELPVGLLFGYGFKVANITIPFLHPTGDNTYFSVLMDLGLIGFLLYLVFLRDIYRRTKVAVSRASTEFTKLFTYHVHIWLKVVIVAMLVQDILWPLHSRGSTMIIFLIMFEISFMISNKAVNKDTIKDTDIDSLDIKNREHPQAERVKLKQSRGVILRK